MHERDINASVDTKPMMYSFDDASAACAIASTEGNIDSIPIQHIAHRTLETAIIGSKWRLLMETEIESDVCDLATALEDPIDDSEWPLALDIKIKGKLKVDYAAVSSIYELAASTLRVAIY